ncbi:MAG: hypothetical protein LC117_00270 [Bacteroidia bacterium]|nr:hypothetical protein [Bacteroidia bacterium]MCZ2276350.1 hypothetical protein [Bacteroidia bacterium]
MKYLFFSLIIISSGLVGDAQNINAYNDYRNHFFVFNTGVTTQLEHQKIISFKTSLRMVAYEDNTNTLKVWCNNQVTTLEKAWNGTYDVTDHMVVFLNFGVLRVFNGTHIHELTTHAGKFTIAEDAVLFLDEQYLFLKAFINGRIYELENIAIGDVHEFKAGYNTAAFITYNNRFNIFYNGIMTQAENYPPVSYQCGKDVIAWIDESTQLFKAFISGKIFKLSEFKPKSYQVADSLIAFIGEDGDFNVVTGKTTRKIEPSEPPFYSAVERMVVYELNGYFMAYVNGAKYELEAYIPEHYHIHNDKIAWLDSNNRIKLLINGNIETVTYQGTKNFSVNGNTVYFIDNTGQEKIYFNKKVY